MGSKTSARRVAIAAGAPVVPGTDQAVREIGDAKKVAARLGYPVLLKAAAGGGGKGMRRVDREQDLESAVRDASSEALRAFHNDEVYIEKLVVEPRHIEIQVLGDHHGHMIHLGERECSIQRRHQKVIEECPSPVMLKHPELRSKMGEAALKIAGAAGYANAGTMEFLVDRDRNFYFLEMNTRLQVEHPVTELATGLDLVQWQLRIAAGEKLTIAQDDVHWTGSAIECRVYAEDPENQFLPSPGKITHLEQPSGPGIRLDSGVYSGWTVPLDYDPMLAKLAVWALDTGGGGGPAAARSKGIRGGRNPHQRGVLRRDSLDPKFRSGELSTAFLEEFFKRRAERKEAGVEQEAVAALIAALQVPKAAPAKNGKRSAWAAAGREEMMR